MKDHDPPLVTQAQSEGVLWLTLGGGKAHALSLAMIQALHQAIDAAQADADVRVLVLHGPGRIFCAGHDLKEIARHRADADDGQAYLTELFTQCGAMMQALATSSKPTIAMVEGIATAGGLQLVASCDMAFSARAATFCLPGVQNGGFCTTPSVAVARAIGPRRCMEMALSGEVFGADWAREAGLVNRVVHRDVLARETRSFARTLASRHAPAIADGKAALAVQIAQPLDAAYAHATQVMIGHFMDPHRIAQERETWGKKA